MPNNHRSQLEEDIRKCKCLPRVSDLDQKSKHQETTNQKAPPCQSHYVLSRKLPEITRCLYVLIYNWGTLLMVHTKDPWFLQKSSTFTCTISCFMVGLGNFYWPWNYQHLIVIAPKPTFQATVLFVRQKKGHRFCFNAHTHISSHVSLSSCNTNSVSDIRFFQLPTNDHDFGSSVYTHPHQVHS